MKNDSQNTNLNGSGLSVDSFLTSAQGQRCRSTLGEARARWLVRAVQERARINIPTQSPSRRHLTRELFGEADWAELPPGATRNCAGMCMAYLVIHKLLPLRTHRTRSGRGSRSYWLLVDQIDSTGNSNKGTAGPADMPDRLRLNATA